MRTLFKSKLFLLLITTLVVLIIIGLTAGENSKLNWLNNLVSVPLSPLQKAFSISGQKVEASLSFFNDIRTLRQENEELKLKIDLLEKEKSELMEFREKNKELKEALNLKDQFNDFDFVGANIISKDSGNWFNIFRIDRGNKDQISGNFPVITSKGLVGRIVSSDIISSKVISIIDEDCTVSARIAKTSSLVIVRGDSLLKNEGLCRLDYIPPEIDVAVGDKIETSGVGGIFPKGITIGEVKEIRQTNNELSRYAVIQPAVDFKRLEEVFVLKSKNNNAGTGSVEK